MDIRLILFAQAEPQLGFWEKLEFKDYAQVRQFSLP